jgi:hypothetical protein
VNADWNESPKQLLHLSYYGKLAAFFLNWYLIPVLLLLWLLVFFWLRKMKWQFTVTALFFFGHILLINFTHTTDDVLSPYFERMYLPVIPIVLIPFVFTLCRELEMRPAFILIAVVLIVGWRIGRFTDLGADYREKTQLTMKLIDSAQKIQGSKFIISNEDQLSCYSWADWSYPMETLLRSAAIDGYKNVTIVLTPDLDENGNRDRLQENEFLFRRWDVMKDRGLNANYFSISPGRYTYLPQMCQ